MQIAVENRRNLGGRTVGSSLDKADGYAPGFGALRLVAAWLVVIGHAWWLTGAYDPIYSISGRQTFLGSLAVGVFFVMSGFLIAESLIRSKSLIEYAINRFLRIFPGLLIVILLSACALGPAFTTLSMADYFSNRLFFAYFLNLTGASKLQLPDVFGEHIRPFVNGSLWTLRYEALSYFLLAVLGALGLLSKKRAILGLTACLVLIGGIAIGEPREVLSMKLSVPLGALNSITVGPTLRLLPYFMVGVSAYLWRDYFFLDWRLAMLSCVACIFGLIEGAHDLLFPICGGYLAIYFGMQERLNFSWLRGRDYSYGTYIYSFPIQQMAIALFPAASFWWGNVLLSAPLIAAFAVMSWSCVEKPALLLKRFQARSRVHELFRSFGSRGPTAR